MLRWRWHLLTVIIASGIIAAIFSSSAFITPKYKSTAVLYPVNLVPYSNESATEQLLQLLQSADVRESVIKKFDLAGHYNLPDQPSGPSTLLIREYSDNVKITKTEFESVSIEVLDKDPKIACDMVNEIINGMNLKARALQREKSSEMSKMLSAQLENKRNEIDSLKAQINELRIKYNVLDLDLQTREVTRGILQGSNQAKAEMIAENLKKTGAELKTLQRRMDDNLVYLSKIKSSYDDVTADLNKELTYGNVVTKPFPADVKSYPIRWLIIVVSVFSSFFLALLVIGIAENKKKKLKLSRS